VNGLFKRPESDTATPARSLDAVYHHRWSADLSPWDEEDHMVKPMANFWATVGGIAGFIVIVGIGRMIHSEQEHQQLIPGARRPLVG